jgi:patatin-like phospholipase/acyl hydrolase
MNLHSQCCYKILSIDGGGIKGLYSATVLQKMEERYGPLHQHFNLICGTSTGGIIALALASGIPASKVVEFYKESGPKIFPYHSSWKRKLHWLKQILWKSKYSNKHLREALEGVFGEKKIEDCKAHVLIPTVNITTGEPCVFKSDHVPQLTRDKKRLLTEVALATSAAPTYFPIVELQMKTGIEQFVDGGLVANNPALYGIQEYLKHYKNDVRFNDYSLLSISSLNEAVKFPELVTNKRKSFVSWNDKLISLMVDSQSAAVHHHIEHLRSHSGGSYVRIPSMALTADEKKNVALDMASKKSLSIFTRIRRKVCGLLATPFAPKLKSISKRISDLPNLSFTVKVPI